MRIRTIALALAVILLLSMVGCARSGNSELAALEDEHAAEVERELEVFTDGDISDITATIFGDSSDVTDGDSGDGIIADLFANAQASITATDDAAITYTIVSPDISDFFQVKADELDEIATSEELGQAILAYAETAPEKEYTVTLPYTITEEGIDVAYDSPEFINAMTGGLLDAYAALYEQYLAEEG